MVYTISLKPRGALGVENPLEKKVHNLAKKVTIFFEKRQIGQNAHYFG